MDCCIVKVFIRQFRNKNLLYTTLFTVLLIATSFYPLPQIVLLELSYLYEPLTDISTLDLMPTYFVVNTFLSIGILLLFYVTNGTFWIITSNTLAMIFMYPTLVYAFHELSTPVMPLLLAAMVYGVGMIGVATFKINASNSDG